MLSSKHESPSLFNMEFMSDKDERLQEAEFQQVLSKAECDEV